MRKTVTVLLTIAVVAALAACAPAQEAPEPQDVPGSEQSVPTIVEAGEPKSDGQGSEQNASEYAIVESTFTPKKTQFELDFEAFMADAQPLLSEDVTEKVRTAITESESYWVTDEWNNVKVSLPIGVYELRTDESGVSYWDKNSFCYVNVFQTPSQVVVNLDTDPLLMSILMLGESDLAYYTDFCTYINQAHTFGDAIGQVAFLTDADGVYVYDGTTVTQLEYTPEGRNVGKSGVEFPAELLAQVELTDLDVWSSL